MEGVKGKDRSIFNKVPFLKKTGYSSKGIAVNWWVEPPRYTWEWSHQYTQLLPTGKVMETVESLEIMGATSMLGPRR